MGLRQAHAPGAILGLRGWVGRCQVPGVAGAGGDRVAVGARGALLPHPVPGRNRQGLRAHRARQGRVAAPRGAAPRLAQCADADRHAGDLAVRRIAGRRRADRAGLHDSRAWCSAWRWASS
ncbi:hypothetical protein G6F22_019494 [Rhizopus arrhizus]|nr:hypothetical protein G6F22_019494 [Rhizopus arrhizus]